MYPQRIWINENFYDFDCIGGTGEPIYFRTDHKGNRHHAILITKEAK